MDQLLEQIEQYRQEIAAIVPDGPEALEAYRIRFLGTKGIVKGLFTDMKHVPVDRKKEFGQVLNEFKQLAESTYEDWKGRLVSDAGPARNIDVSLIGQGLSFTTPGRDNAVGVFTGVQVDYKIKQNVNAFVSVEGQALSDSSLVASARGGVEIKF